MPNAGISNARICLRCEARLILSRKARFVASSDRPRGVLQPFATTARSFQVADHQLPRIPVRRPSPIHHPLGRLHGPPGHELREDIASLDTPSLGKPSEVVVLRDANLDASTVQRKLSKDERYSSAQELLASIKAEKGLLTYEDVKTNMDRLRPRLDELVLSKAEFDELANKVRDGFTTVQMLRYLDGFKKAEELVSRSDVGDSGDVRHDGDGEMLIQQTEWRPGTTPFNQDEQGRPKLEKPRYRSRKEKLASRVLRNCWKVQIEEVVESMGELELTLSPLGISLLLRDDRKLLKRYSESYRAKLDVLRSKGLIRITADKESAGSVVRSIKAALEEVRCMLVDLRPLRAALGDSKKADRLADGGTLHTISQMTGVRIAVQNEGNTLAIRTLEPSLTPAYDARRLLLADLTMPSSSKTQAFCGGSTLVDEATLSSVESSDDLPWNEREKSWTRLTSIAHKGTGEDTSQVAPQDVMGSSDGYHKSLLQSTQDFLRDVQNAPRLKANRTDYEEQGDNTAGIICLESSADSTEVVSWDIVAETSTSVVFGNVLHEVPQPVPDPLPTPQELCRASLRHRAFSFSVPGLLRSVSMLSEQDQPVTESLLIRLKPSPWSIVGGARSRLFPDIEVTINVDPHTKETTLTNVEAIVDRRLSDIMLPDKVTDLRFMRQDSVRLRRPHNAGDIINFLAQSSLSLQSQGRLTTPPGLTLSVPSWNVSADADDPASSSHLSTTTKMEYLFAGLEHRQTLHVVLRGWKGQYAAVEAGKTGGRRGEFRLFMERAPEVYGRGADGTQASDVEQRLEGSSSIPQLQELNFEAFFSTAFHFVDELKKQVVDDVRLEKPERHVAEANHLPGEEEKK